MEGKWKAMVVAGATAGVAVGALGMLAWRRWCGEGREEEVQGGGGESVRAGVLGLIGDTPLIELTHLSEATGCRILGKAEFMNPGGSTKDRAALRMVQDALDSGALAPGGTVYEGSSGSTGISLTLVSLALGLSCRIYMPSDQAVEKSDMMERLGADVQRVPPVSIVDSAHYVNQARAAAEQDPDGFFADQFENPSNWRAHYQTTGPEIWRQTAGTVDAVVMAAGTGGTLAGVMEYLWEQNPEIMGYLADPQGSALYNAVVHGVCYSETQDEGRRKRNQVDTITEGIGLYRLTHNFQRVQRRLDGAFRVSDADAVAMSRHLALREGLFLGSSSAVNCVAAVRLAKQLGPGHTIVTVLCDAGYRHLTKLWNPDFLHQQGLLPSDPLPLLSS